MEGKLRIDLVAKPIENCRSMSAKPTGIKKEKDIPGLPENYKKLYRNFGLLFFHLYIIVAFIFQRLYM